MRGELGLTAETVYLRFRYPSCSDTSWRNVLMWPFWYLRSCWDC